MQPTTHYEVGSPYSTIRMRPYLTHAPIDTCHGIGARRLDYSVKLSSNRAIGKK